MSIQSLDFGTEADDDGEFPYTAWPKVQANFEDLYSQLAALGLDTLTDVVISSPLTGQVLKYNGTNWVNDTDDGSGGGGDETVTTPAEFGAVGDGVTNDASALQSAINATPTGGLLRFDGRPYRINTKLVINKSINIDFANSTITLNSSASPNNHHFDIYSTTDTAVVWTETLARGVSTFTVTAPGIAVGDSVVLSLGTDQYDSNEQHFVRVCKVTANTGSAITVDVHTPYAINGTSHSIAKITSLVANCSFKNLVVDYASGATPDTHIYGYWMCNVVFENIRAVKARILFNLFESHNVRLSNVDATVVRSGVSSHGRVFTGWQLENCAIENVSARGTDSAQMVFLESWCRGIKFDNLQLISTNASQTNAMMQISGGCYDIEFNGLLVSPAAAVELTNSGGTPVSLSLKKLRFIRTPASVDLSTVQSFADAQAGFSFMNPVGFLTNKAEGSITTSGSKFVKIANGILRRLWVYVEDTTGITAFIVNDAGTSVSITSQLVAGQWIEITDGSKYGSSHTVNTYANPTKQVNIFADGTAGVNKKFAVVAEYWPISANADTLRLRTNNDTNNYLPSGHITDWNNGDVTLTHSANALAFSGASNGYSFAERINPTGGVAAAGGFSTSPRCWHTGGRSAFASTDGTNQTPVATEVYICEVFVEANATITGVAIFNGSAVSGNVKVGLANSSGAVVATSSSTAQSGTDAYQRVPFTSTYAAVGPATYYVLVFIDNATGRLNAHPFGNFGAGKQTGQTFSTGFTTITPPTTFTADLGTMASLY